MIFALLVRLVRSSTRCTGSPALALNLKKPSSALGEPGSGRASNPMVSARASGAHASAMHARTSSSHLKVQMGLMPLAGMMEVAAILDNAPVLRAAAISACLVISLRVPCAMVSPIVLAVGGGRWIPDGDTNLVGTCRFGSSVSSIDSSYAEL